MTLQHIERAIIEACRDVICMDKARRVGIPQAACAHYSEQLRIKLGCSPHETLSSAARRHGL